MPTVDDSDQIDTVRASRAGHTFHERWAARRALQLVFPKDNLFAIAVEGRREDAFPKLLLSMLDHEPIDGVKLVLTVRTHRKDTVIGRAGVFAQTDHH